MDIKALLPIIMPILVLHICTQIYYIIHCYQNNSISRKAKCLYIIGIIILNLPIAVIYLFKEKDEGVATIANYRTVDIDNHIKHGIFIFLLIAYEIFTIRLVIENKHNPKQLLMIMLLCLTLFVCIVNQFIRFKADNTMPLILPIIALLLVIPLEYFDYTYNAHFIMVIVAASIINNASIITAKTFSITAFCVFLIGSTAKAFKYYQELGINGTASFLYISIMIFLLVIVGFYSLKNNLLVKKRLTYAIKIVNEQAQQLEAVGAISERNRITAEIHDNVGHQLTGAVIMIENLKAEITNKKTLDKLILVKEQVKQGLNDIRHSVRAIKDQQSPFALQIGKLIADIRDNTGFMINYELDLKNELLPIHKYLLLQIVKECATNSIKHGKCSEADLLIQEANNKIYFSFSDNGIGVDLLVLGFGLNSMKERVESFGGAVFTKSEEHEGFTVSISLPIGDNHGGSV